MTITIGYPQAVFIVFMFLELAWLAAKHGEPRDPYNFWEGVGNYALFIPLLWWGGFFK